MSFLYGRLCLILYMRLNTFFKICVSALLVSAILLPCVFLLDVRIPLNFRSSYNAVGVKKMEMKTILYWTKMFNDETFYFGEGEIFGDCEISACRATHDRNMMKIEEFDALLFHGFENRRSDIPKVRSNKQKYVFVLLESPENYGLDSAYLPDQFYNWTMTYRRDSDIPRPYGFVIDSITNQPVYPIWTRTKAVSTDTLYEDLRPPESYARFKGKKKTAAWFVSHCRTTSLREWYVNELKNHMDVDVFGACGPLSCKYGDAKCYKMLESTYYFYIAFENSLCEDYVTEKLYKVMSYDIVPIVYGAVNYTEFAPPGSYINVADFESPKHLADHLRYLINNPDEYAKFFWWKKHFHIDLSHRVTLCQMCEMLHNEDALAPNNPTDIKGWWTKDKCHSPTEIWNSLTKSTHR